MNSKTFEEIFSRFDNLRFDEQFDMIVAIANGGIIPAAILNQRLGIEFQLLKLSLRDKYHNQVHSIPVLVEDIKYDVSNKNILVVEDRVRTGATLNFACNLLLKKGAASIKTFAVNGEADYYLYNEPCFPFPWNMKT